MLDHVSLGVSDLERSRRFYDAVLGPLGIVRIVDFQDFQQCGSDWGTMPGPLGVEFTITLEPPGPLASRGMHVCFRAPNRDAVHAFHAAAVLCGGRSDGEPGLCTQYHSDYFAALRLDPDSHRIEAVCHAPSAATLA